MVDFGYQNSKNSPRTRSYCLICRKSDLEDDLASFNISIGYLGIAGTLLFMSLDIVIHSESKWVCKRDC